MQKKPKKSTEFKNFERLTRQVLGVDKKEIDEREKERPVRRRKRKPPSD